MSTASAVGTAAAAAAAVTAALPTTVLVALAYLSAYPLPFCNTDTTGRRPMPINYRVGGASYL